MFMSVIADAMSQPGDTNKCVKSHELCCNCADMICIERVYA